MAGYGRREVGVRTCLDAVDGLECALRLILLLREDGRDAAAGLGVPRGLFNVLNGGLLGRHCGWLFMKISSVVVVDMCCCKEEGADWEFYDKGGVMQT